MLEGGECCGKRRKCKARVFRSAEARYSGEGNVGLSLEGAKGMSHGAIWARAFPAEGTARSQGEHVPGLFQVTPLPEG